MAKKKKIQQSNNGKIYVGMPRERIFIPAFVDNRDKILSFLQSSGRGCGYFQAEGHRVDRNRDLIVKRYLEHEDKPEWLVMLDTDMEHPIDVTLRLTNWNKDIVGGLYFYRGESHDPFVFKAAKSKKDEFGRILPQWKPMRDLTYRFLKAHNVPVHDGALAIMDAKDPLVECDAVATGAIAIHRSVIEGMKRPLFEYRDHGTSEDLMFCKEAKEAGFSIYCDLSTISGHYHWQPMGFVQFMQLYETRGTNMTVYTLEESAEVLAEYLHIPYIEAENKIRGGNAHMVGDYWNARFKNRVPTREEVIDFYEDDYTGNLYLIELLHWNGSEGFQSLRKQFLKVRDSNVFELGSGIGTLAMQLALQGNKVTAFEINSVLRGFAELRAKKLFKSMGEPPRGLKFMAPGDPAPVGGFDHAFAIDVFEHIAEDNIAGVLEYLNSVLKINGRLVYHANFGQQNIYPMHFDYSSVWPKLLEEAGFVQISQLEALKVRNVDR
jgi:hypothetical protein